MDSQIKKKKSIGLFDDTSTAVEKPEKRRRPKAKEREAEIETSTPERIFSVSEFVEFLNILFEEHTFRVVGEITQFKRQNGSGHCYFTIKDKDAGSVLDCIIWSRNYELCG